jgi:heptosyltransferase-3
MAERLTEAGMGPGQRLAVVHPVSRWLFKAWPEASCAETIIRLVREIPVAVALTSGPRSDEIETANRILARAQLGRGGGPIINLIGHTSVGELAALLELASLFVGVDSAPMHMAAALGVPVVALFGPSGEMSWGPWGEGHAVIASPYLCRPCGRDGCLGGKRSDCLEAITTDEVVAAVAKVMRRLDRRNAFECSSVREFGGSGVPGSSTPEHSNSRTPERF